MMNYIAVCLNSGGGVVRDEDTQEVMNMQIGEHESMELVIENACEQSKTCWLAKPRPKFLELYAMLMVGRQKVVWMLSTSDLYYAAGAVQSHEKQNNFGI